MPKLSSGLLLHRLEPAGELSVLLVHPGGPFWSRKDDGAWSIPKGEYLDGEDTHEVALREFTEELGTAPPDGPDIFLGEIRQPSGKRLTVWARRGDFDATSCSSNAFDLEWPPGSARVEQFPEVDRAEWFTVQTARLKLLKGQVPFLDELISRHGAQSEQT